jgi:hypothetical protein
MKKFDALKKKPSKEPSQATIIPQASTPVKPRNNKQKVWFFSSIAIILVFILWGFSLKANWQRFNQAGAANEAQNFQDFDALKTRVDNIISETSVLIDRIGEIDTITATNTPSTTQRVLSEEQIIEISNELKEVEANPRE